MSDRLNLRRSRAAGAAPNPGAQVGGSRSRSRKTAPLLAAVDSSRPMVARERREDDWYVEPPWAVEGLFDVQRFYGSIRDPACGRGTIPAYCRARGYDVFASDLRDRGYGEAGLDFLRGDWPIVDNIICNPPFLQAEPFVRRALRFARQKVAMLLRLTWAESIGRRWVWDESPLAAIHVFANRVSMPPGDYEGEATGGAACFAWWIWSHDHVRVGNRWAPPIVTRIERAPPPRPRRRLKEALDGQPLLVREDL